MPRTNATRRRFLALSGAAGLAGVAGCADRLESVTDSSDDAGNEATDDDPSAPAALADGVPPIETEYDSRERYRQPGESLDDFGDLDAWEVVQGSGEADEDVVFDGEQSFHLESDGRETIVAERSLEETDLTETDLSVAIRTTTPQNLTVNLRIVDQFGSARVHSLREVTYRTPDVGWFRASPGVFEEDEHEPAMDHLDRLEIQVLHSMDEAEVWIDDLRRHEKPDEGYVVLTWDDGFRDYYETASPLHDEYGFRTVQAPVPRWTEQGRDGVMSVSELQERQDEGDQIVVHGTHEPIHEYEDESTIERRLRQDKRWFVDNGFEGANYIVFPHNSFDKTSLEHATGYHYCGGFNQAGNVNTTGVHGFDPLALPRTIGHDLEISKRCVDLAAAHNQCTILNFHAFEADNTMSEDDYEQLLAHIDEADVEVITFDDLWELRTSRQS
ncbi:Peptidoglycan/xylan/chitin deacetylase, PgdA/CDA1 family [Halobiforma haloterrestris]|uniref:Peptidoglycan/xylan/chitin deacetylase, PgdA/CDA1 family n=1 Tax=Natronobacterium haloterrestre TaxID=148448 RepID=A0A1I1H6A8_NATHA|nr:polysaccharide deacetylase family protein [Halobiforma haloterrestris]SFC19351.1 Peptidoglycan/xylan/chitin deacetylase, PgdA/CDA1 family [Halobiforma haloterrestris]